MGLLQLLTFFLLLSLSHSESKGGPREAVCSQDNIGFKLKEGHGPVPDLDKEEYKATITLVKEGEDTPVDCVEGGKTKYEVIINATKKFKGFIITSTVPGTGYPARFVGKFDYRVWLYSPENLVRACENTMAHSDILKDNPVTLKWKSDSSAKDVEFLFAIAFSRFVWIHDQRVQFPACQKEPREKCIERSDSDSVSSGIDPSSSAAGSAQIEDKCRPAKTDIELTHNITVGDHTIVYKCTGRTQLCRGKCAYCDETCKSTSSMKRKILLPCSTDDAVAVLKTITRRVELPVDETCQCSCKDDKCDTNTSSSNGE